MNQHILKAYKKGKLALFLGAGASLSSKNKRSEYLLSGEGLAKKLAEEVGINYSGEPLQSVFSAVNDILGSRILDLLEDNYKHCKPSEEYLSLARFPFPRIYTINIDDAFESALDMVSSQRINIKRRTDRVVDPDQIFEELDFIKLNGDVQALDQGVIFSESEYINGIVEPPLWYQELARDYQKYTFLFVGTKLNEPIFKSEIERYKRLSSSVPGKSYLLIPEISEFERLSLEGSKIEHIPGRLSDFSDYLEEHVKPLPKPIDILLESRPEIKLYDKAESHKYIDVFKDVVPVSRSNLIKIIADEKDYRLKVFYKGFKPSWKDVIEEVPAILKRNETVFDVLSSYLDKPGPNLYCIFGNAGSGKSTLLKQSALAISDAKDVNVYFVDDIQVEVGDLLDALEATNREKYYVFVDRVAEYAKPMGQILKDGKCPKAIVVCTESKSIWSYRAAEYLTEYVSDSIDISSIEDSDAPKILDKIEKYGNWTRLGKISKRNRERELIQKSRRQLLIGLIETTSGEGYKEIIRSEYESLEKESYKALIVLVGLATYQRTYASEGTVARTLLNLGINENIGQLCNDLDGILYSKNGKIHARHYIYVEHLFTYCVPLDFLVKIIKAFISAFTVYSTPIVTNVSKADASVFKFLVNAKSLNKLLHHEELVLDVYKSFEKEFEHEGLFLLQYGLALRSYKYNSDAYEKILLAYHSYPESPQIEHALALQKIILALQVDNESEAFGLFEEAQDILDRLNKADIKINDGYPIVTLSEGHVKLLVKFGDVSKARLLAKQYHDQITRQFGQHISGRVSETVQTLKRFYISGKTNDLNRGGEAFE